MCNRLIGMLLLVCPVLSQARDVSNNVLTLFSHINSFFTSACYIVGVGLIIGAFIQYQDHKRNRLQVPISRPIMFLVLGVVIIIIPLIGQLSVGGQVATR